MAATDIEVQRLHSPVTKQLVLLIIALQVYVYIYNKCRGYMSFTLNTKGRASTKAKTILQIVMSVTLCTFSFVGTYHSFATVVGHVFFLLKSPV